MERPRPCTGGRLESGRHEVRVLVKAVTYHALAVQCIDNRWRRPRHP